MSDDSKKIVDFPKPEVTPEERGIVPGSERKKAPRKKSPRKKAPRERTAEDDRQRADR